METTPESTPGTSPSKRNRAKPKGVAKPAIKSSTKSSTKLSTSAAPAAKKSRAPRKTLTINGAADQAAPAPSEASVEDLGGMIATAAYYLAAARNFTPGHELDDWLEAERSVRAKLYG